MPRANGYDLNAKRISRDLVEFDFRSGEERVRGSLPVRLLGAMINAFKRGQVGESSVMVFLAGGGGVSNLSPGAEPTELEKFLFNEYLPKRAKPKLKKSSFDGEVDLAKRIVKTLGKEFLHEIGPVHAEKHKSRLLAEGRVNNSIKKDLHLLSRAMDYAVACGLVQKNHLLRVRDLPTTNRAEVWLRLRDIARLLRCSNRQMRLLVYFLILTGARIGEALEVKGSDIDWKNRVLRLPTEKRRGPSVTMRTKMRSLSMDDLGPRLERLLTIIKPHPRTGYLFTGRFDGQPVDPATVQEFFRKAVKRAGLGHLVPQALIDCGGHASVTPHDCRRTFANHLAIAGFSFHKIRACLGHIHAASIQAYLDEAVNHDPSESIFFKKPRTKAMSRGPEGSEVAAEPVSNLVPRGERQHLEGLCVH